MHEPSILTFDTTLEVRDACLCMHVQRAARALARRYDEALRPSGLTNGQFSVLMALNRLKPARMRDLVSLLSMDRTTLTAILKPLSRRGLLDIEPDPRDRRGRTLVLTVAGKDALMLALPGWQEMQRRIETELEGEAAGLRAKLRNLS